MTNAFSHIKPSINMSDATRANKIASASSKRRAKKMKSNDEQVRKIATGDLGALSKKKGKA